MSGDDGRVDRLLAIARAILAGPDLTADDALMEHGATSLSVVRIVVEANRTLQLEINPGEVDGALTVRNLARAATT